MCVEAFNVTHLAGWACGRRTAVQYLARKRATAVIVACMLVARPGKSSECPTPRDSDMSTPIQIGDFRIERQIGAGGMGIVYLATQVSLDRSVALKLLGQSLTQTSDKARFQREAKAVGKLNHPGIASVYFVGQDERFCYMAMEYIDGVSLRAVIERLSRTTDPTSTIDSFLGQPERNPIIERFDQLTEDYLPTDATNPYRSPQAEEAICTVGHIQRCAELVHDAALALQHAHRHGVIHRDLKPENLMLGKDGRVRIIDFGVATFFDDASLTRTGALVGTPMYMSPEQVTGRIKLDVRTDIYSLGLVLYELLSVAKPVTGKNRDAVLRRIVTKPLVPISHVNSEVSGDLQNVVHKATSKDPDDRYQSARDLADDLSRFVNGREVLAPPYRYKLDQSEIVSQRPSIIVLLSFFHFAVALYALTAGIGYLLQLVVLSENRTLRFEELLFLMFGIWSSLNGWALMSARKWSRASNAFQALLGAGLLGYSIPEFTRHQPDDALYCYLICIFLLSLALAPFVVPNVRRWFDHANHVRCEHSCGSNCRDEPRP